MRAADAGGSPRLYRFALWVAAGWVPRPLRAEWLAEWKSELWYVGEALAREGDDFPRARWGMARFCLGALKDVRCVRKLHGMGTGRVRAAGSALSCAAWLALGALVCAVLAQELPGVRRAVQPGMYWRVNDVVAISPMGWSGAASPPSRLGVVRSWQRRSQHLFAGFAYYEPVVKAVHVGPHDAPELTIGRGSANLLAMLGVPVSFAQHGGGEGTMPELVLSEKTWRSCFGGSRAIFGLPIKVGLQTVRVSGVVPDETTPAPGRVDAWLLLPDRVTEAMPDSARVFAFGKTEGEPTSKRWLMSVGSGTEHRSDFDCVALSARGMEIWRIFGFTVFLALLALPATTSLPLGDYPGREVTLPWPTGVRRWLFFATKIGLVLPAIYLGSMDLAFAIRWSGANTAEYIQLVTSFCATLFAFRWALRDQRQRCPVCLRRLTCPVRVGQPSRNFLSWSGTELMCSGGHGLLHVPELPTSWFGAPRWLHLDPSWSGLFISIV